MAQDRVPSPIKFYFHVYPPGFLHIHPRVKKRVSERVSPRVMHRIRSETLGKTLGETLGKTLGETLGKTLGETLAETFRTKESRQEYSQESRIGSYAWLSARLSSRLVFLRGPLPYINSPLENEHFPFLSFRSSQSSHFTSNSWPIQLLVFLVHVCPSLKFCTTSILSVFSCHDMFHTWSSFLPVS